MSAAIANDVQCNCSAIARPVMCLPVISSVYIYGYVTSTTSHQMVSFWRPIPPMRNYKPLGDVVVLGSKPPDVPVAVYRNDAALQDLRAAQVRVYHDARTTNNVLM